MSTIYYHFENEEWYQCEEENGLQFGKENTIISYFGSRKEKSLPFSVTKCGERVGPLIAILTGSSKDDTFIGNLKVLKRLLSSLQAKGALGIVITPDSLQEHSVKCFTFYQPLQKWIKLHTPLPNVVYNRIPYRQMEKSKLYIDMVSFLKSKDIPFFNPYFFSKWNVYQMLHKNELISSFLPETSLLKQKSDLDQMLTKHQDVYIKCSSGYKGIGLYRIKKLKNTYSVETPFIKQNFTSLTSFWEDNKEVFFHDEYLLQKTIQADTFKGKRYDLRLLCHYGESGYLISGLGVRVSGENEVTTHVPNGGSIIPYKAVSHRFNEDILQQLASEIGKELSEQMGQFIGEFSIDLGRSLNGEIYIYEINSKPMVFDEMDIREKGLENLTKLLIMKGT